MELDNVGRKKLKFFTAFFSVIVGKTPKYFAKCYVSHRNTVAKKGLNSYCNRNARQRRELQIQKKAELAHSKESRGKGYKNEREQLGRRAQETFA